MNIATKSLKRYAMPDGDEEMEDIYQQRKPNFPPVLKIVYYNPKDVPLEYKKQYLISNVTGVLIESALILNFATTIVIALNGYRVINVLYTILNFILVTTLTIYTLLSFFYCLIKPTIIIKRKYFFLHGTLMTILALFIVLDKGSINGLMRLSDINNIHDQNLENITGYWSISTVVESIIYASTLGLSGYCIYLIAKLKINRELPV